MIRIAPITPLILKTSDVKAINPKVIPNFSGCGAHGKNDKAFCWKRNEFVGDTAFRVTARLNRTVGVLDSSLWFTARTKSSSIGVSKDASGTLIAFTGKPVLIGNASANLPVTRDSYEMVINLNNIATREYDPNYDFSKFYTFDRFLKDPQVGLSTETLASVKQWNAFHFSLRHFTK